MMNKTIFFNLKLYILNIYRGGLPLFNLIWGGFGFGVIFIFVDDIKVFIILNLISLLYVYLFIYNRIINVKYNNFIKCKYTKDMFITALFSINPGILSVFFIMAYQKGFSINMMLIAANVLFIFLLVITSHKGINLLFKFYLFFLDINNIIDDFFYSIWSERGLTGKMVNNYKSNFSNFYNFYRFDNSLFKNKVNYKNYIYKNIHNIATFSTSSIINNSHKLNFEKNIFKNYLNSINNILKKYNIDENLITNIEYELYFIGFLFPLIKKDNRIDIIKNIKKEINNKFKSLGIKSSLINKIFYECEKEFENNLIKNESENLFELDNVLKEINNIVSSKNTKLSNKVLNYFINVFSIYIKINSLKSERDNLIENLIKTLLKDQSLTTKIKGRKKKVKALSGSDYKGEFSITVNSYSDLIKNNILNWVMENYKDDIDKLLSNMDNLRNELFKGYVVDVSKLLLKDYSLKYGSESMKNVVEKKNKEYENFLKEFSFDKVININKLLDHISNYNLSLENSYTEGGDSKVVKKIYKFKIEEPLMKNINNIINNNILSNRDKQIGIENLCLEYDLNWFSKEMKESVDARSVILHDIHKKIDSSLNYIIKPYIKSNYLKLKKLYIDSNLDKLVNNNKYQGIFKGLLIIMILGNKNVISTSFKLIIDIITKSDDNMEINKTELIFKLGNNLYKFAHYMLYKLINKIEKSQFDKDFELIDKLENILKIVNKDKLFELFDNISENDKFEIGDSILRIILDKTDILSSELKTLNKNREVLISISDDYIKKLNISCINVTQLPMLIQPNIPNEKGKYLPYIHGEISHIYNTFDTIIKSKYDIRDSVKNQYALVNSIIYLNNMPFSINDEILKFITEEWYNDESSFFKGKNKLLIINKNDNEEVKNNKKSHNSKYWRYLNTINIATVYSKCKFYIPTFADFRGRLYTLTNYLTYQGDDLSRSLLLFNPDINTPLTDKGFYFLLIYFANLAGQDKYSIDDRIDWTRKNFTIIYEDFLSNRNKFYSEHLINIKDKLQFISIMFAIVKVLNAESKGNRSDVIINNPILFDASCNGLQHLSALTRELNTAIQTNLVSLPDTDTDTPNDYYNFAGNIVQKEIDKCNIENISNLKINRTFIKLTVMTIPYNISLFGVKEQMKEQFSVYKEGKKHFYKVPAELTKNNKSIYLYPSELIKLGEIVYNSLINNLPSLKILNNYLDELLTILIKLDRPIIWITPAGLKISLSNIKFKKERTTSSLIPYGKPVTISIPTNKLNTRKIKTSFMPNLIHSLDASNIHLLCKNLNAIPLYTIHDCFASTCNNMEIIENKVKITFIEIYFSDSNYIEKMHNNLLEQIKSYIGKDEIQIINNEEFIKIDNKLYKIPNLPEAFTNKEIMNTFVQGIMRSKFFIS